MRYSNRNVDSDALEKKLEQALIRRDAVETHFRAKHVRQWTVLFCDVSRLLNEATELTDETRKYLIEKYSALVIEIFNQFEPTFLSEVPGPQMLACFEEPTQAADAAILIQNTLKSWKDKTDGSRYFIPSIGMHTGDFVVKDGELLQSNACNLGKRIETEARNGNIFISSTTYNEIRPTNKYHLTYVRTAMVKNIPEPQKIFSLAWNSAGAPKLKTDKLPLINIVKQEEVFKGYMGILVCDVSGSSKKFWQLGDREGNMLIEMYRKEVFPVLMKHRAYSIEISDGDQITATFPDDRIINTVLAGIEIQKDLFRRNVNMGSRQKFKLETSIGLHAGEVELRDKKISHNSAFYTCKTIQGEADPNEVFISEEMKNYLLKYPNISVVQAGETVDKTSGETIKVYNLEWFKSRK